MTKQTLIDSIIADLGTNFRNTDSDLLGTITDEVIDDALIVSNRKQLNDLEKQLDVLGSNIRKCVKSIYLIRGAEDVKSQSLSGLNSTYENAVETMAKDIIRSNKRILM